MTQSKNPPTKKQRYTGTLRQDLRIFDNGKNDQGVNTWTIFDPVTDKYFRVSEKEYIIIKCLDKNLPLEELTQKLKQIDEQITEQHILSVLSFLTANMLLQSTYSTTESRLLQMRLLKAKTLAKKYIFSYLFIKIPIWNPDNFLSRTLHYVKALASKWVIIPLAIISGCGYIGVVINWHKFTTTVIDSLTYSGLIRYGVTIIFLKVFHEFAHAYSAKLLGIRVRRFGIGLVIFFPRFYTDITDSWQLNKRRQRVLIDVAGILFELFAGGIAALIWFNTGPGTIHTVSYYIFAVSIISTLLVNGNPFIKFDGYYLLMDLVGIDNLQRQGITEIKHLIRKYLFGIKEKIIHIASGWKRYFVVIYGISSFIYRIFLYTGIILIIYFKFAKAIGIILVCIEVYALLIRPIINESRQLIRIKNKIKNKNLRISIAIFAILLAIFFLPLPWLISIPCVVNSKSNIIYLQQSGFLAKFDVKNYQKVKKGQLLFTQKNPFLALNNEELKIRLKMYKTELDQQRSQTKVTASNEIKIQQIINTRNDIKENRRKQELLNVKSPINGTFVLFDWHLKTGKWLNKGEPIGEVFSPENTHIIAYIKEENVNDIHPNDQVSIYLRNETSTYYGKVEKVNPVPSKIWGPSPLLSTSGGPLNVLKEDSVHSFLLKEHYYQVIIALSKKYKGLQYSRTGKVEIRKFSSVGFNLMRKIIKTLQKELTF